LILSVPELTDNVQLKVGAPTLVPAVVICPGLLKYIAGKSSKLWKS